MLFQYSLHCRGREGGGGGGGGEGFMFSIHDVQNVNPNDIGPEDL